jgi:GNAT superfamily N-acetyltransferase
MTGVERATPADRGALVDVLATALATEPIVWWPLRDGADAETFRALFDLLAEVYLPIGALWVTDDRAGVSAWLEPKDADRFLEIEAPTRDGVRPLTEDGGARYDALWDWLGARVPDEPCYFLDMVAVRPDAQGRGLGRRLVDHGLARAFADGMPAFLETGSPGNVPLYEHLGFRVVDAAEPPGGGPTVWFMRADPAS